MEAGDHGVRGVTHRLRILFFGETWQGSSARALCRALAEREDTEVLELGEDHFNPRWKSVPLRLLRRVIAPWTRADQRRQLLVAARNFRPDVLLVYKGQSLSPADVRALAAVGAPRVNIYPDNSPHAFGDRHRRAMGEYDLVISTKPFHPVLWTPLYGYRNRCVFVPHGYDLHVHYAAAPAPAGRYDVVLVATWREQYAQMLREFASTLGERRLRVCVAGACWERSRATLPADWTFPGPALGRAYVDLIRSGAICIAPVHREVVIRGQQQPGDEDTTRTYELAAAGCFFIHRRTPFAQTLYDEATEVPMFDDGRELAAKVLHYVPLHELRLQMAAAAQRRAVPAYSIDARAGEVLTQVRMLLDGRSQSQTGSDACQVPAHGLVSDCRCHGCHYTLLAQRKPRLVVLATHPIQYYAPLYRCLAERGAVDITVIYLSDAGAVGYEDPGFSRTIEWDIPLLEGYAYRVLQPGSPITSRGFWSCYDHKLVAELDRMRPDWLLLYGYASRMNWVALHWAHRRGVRIAYASDSNIRDEQRAFLAPLKMSVLGHFFGRIDAFFAVSEANADYLLRYGADGQKIWRLPFAIDVGRFRRGAEHVFAAVRHYDFIWAGKLIPGKRPSDFVEALTILANGYGGPIRACMAGDGACRDTILSQADRLPSHCKLDFLGFVNQGEMPEVLGAAGILVFTSEREAYGLVAGEAAAAGLALIVAENIGCVGKTVLARPGMNALTYKSGDVRALARAMQGLLTDSAMRSAMQRASVEIAAEHDLPRAAEVVERVVAGGARD